jgi:hypothetical protein
MKDKKEIPVNICIENGTFDNYVNLFLSLHKFLKSFKLIDLKISDVKERKIIIENESIYFK